MSASTASMDISGSAGARRDDRVEKKAWEDKIKQKCFFCKEKMFKTNPRKRYIHEEVLPTNGIGGSLPRRLLVIDFEIPVPTIKTLLTQAKTNIVVDCIYFVCSKSALLRCPCHTRTYCCKACQKADWVSHRVVHKKKLGYKDGKLQRR